jgi:hypothetical protein
MGNDDAVEKTLKTMATELGLIYISDCLKPVVKNEEPSEPEDQVLTGKKEKNFSQLT